MSTTSALLLPTRGPGFGGGLVHLRPAARDPSHAGATARDGRRRPISERDDRAERAEILLSTTRFEALRWRTGRRSRAQLAAMDWSGDPTPVLDHLYMFGPAGADIIE